MIGLPRLLAVNRKLSLLEMVDSAIFGLGLTTLGSALVVKPVLPHFDGNLNETFFAIMYPIADLVLVCVVIATVSMQGYSKRGLILSSGVLVFALTDFLYLWQHINGSATCIRRIGVRTKTSNICCSACRSDIVKALFNPKPALLINTST